MKVPFHNKGSQYFNFLLNFNIKGVNSIMIIMWSFGYH